MNCRKIKSESKVKRTYISADDEITHKNRSGFISVVRYGKGFEIESRDEIGAIVKIHKSSARLDNGMFVETCDVLERIFRK